jgi:transcriptional regulator with XRE-family HTH domain
MHTLQAAQPSWSPTVEYEMKISSNAVRRLRTERGWSQEQLAIACGLSLRTVQRVEAEGIASLSTSTSLAATYQVRLTELQEDLPLQASPKPKENPSALFLGLATLTLVSIGESGRMTTSPFSDAVAALNISAAIIGFLLLAPSLVRLIRQRQFIGTGLAILGAPLLTLLLAGVMNALISGRSPIWQLFVFGATGAALVLMSLREFGRGPNPVGA